MLDQTVATPDRAVNDEQLLADSTTSARLGGPGFLQVLSPRNVGAVYVLLIIVFIFSIWVPSTFPTLDTAKVILNQNAVTAIIALSLVVPLAAGVFDISVGYVMALSSVVTAQLLISTTWPVSVVIVLALVVSGVVGLVNGFLVVALNIHSFIATLASGALIQAIVILVSQQQAITGARLSGDFSTVTTANVLGVTSPVIVALCIAAALWWLLDHTATGRRVYATGFNAQAARLIGISTNRLRFASLLVSSLLAGVAGIIICSQVSAGSPDIGPPYLLNAFATAFLGATQFRAGRFNAWGTVVAALLLGTGATGLSLAGAPTWASSMFTGMILLVALAITNIQRRKRVAGKNTKQLK